MVGEKVVLPLGAAAYCLLTAIGSHATKDLLRAVDVHHHLEGNTAVGTPTARAGPAAGYRHLAFLLRAVCDLGARIHVDLIGSSNITS